MSEREALKLALEALENNKQKHHYCEDTWYSCPKHEDGCANESEGDECNCGADEINAQFDKAITAIKEALAQQDVRDEIDRGAKTLRETYLAQPEQEPVGVISSVVHAGDGGVRVRWIKGFPQIGDRLYTTPPQRTWVGLTDEEVLSIVHYTQFNNARDIEAKLKEKNNG